jgi:predicted transcriptional regulator
MTDAPAMEDLVQTEDPDFEYVMECVFEVPEHASQAYLVLLDKPGSTVKELTQELERDRSNVNRSLMILLERGLAKRERRLLEAGGSVYQYMATPLPEAKGLLHGALDQWVDTVHDSIDGFGDDSV